MSNARHLEKEQCEKWFKELNLVDRGGETYRSEDLFKPSYADEQKAAEIFRNLGKELYNHKMMKARSRIEELKRKQPDIDLLKLPRSLLLALVFYTVDSNPINPKMRKMWEMWKKGESLVYTDDEKFAIAVSILLQSCILKAPFGTTKWNLKRNMHGHKITDKDMPFRCPTSCAQEEQDATFGSEKAILRTRVGLYIDEISYFEGEREVLLPIGYKGKIVSAKKDPTVIHSEDVAPTSKSVYTDPGSNLYGDEPIIYVKRKYKYRGIPGLEPELGACTVLIDPNLGPDEAIIENPTTKERKKVTRAEVAINYDIYEY